MAGIRVKRRIFAGPICEQLVYTLPSRARDMDHYEKKPRFASQEERDTFNTEVARRRHARKLMATFDTGSLYTTLTCDPEHEIHDFRTAKEVAYKYMRRLHRKYPDSTIWMYTGRGRSTSRIHFHMISKGIPADEITKKWKEGSVAGKPEKLRAHNFYDHQDHGRDWTGLANYLFNHWTPEVGGHRWMQTGKSREPEMEPVKEVARIYDLKHPPRAPRGMRLVEATVTPYGFYYFKYCEIVPEPKMAAGMSNLLLS